MRLGEGTEMTLDGVTCIVMPFAQQGRVVVCSVFHNGKPLKNKCIVLELSS